MTVVKVIAGIIGLTGAALAIWGGVIYWGWWTMEGGSATAAIYQGAFTLFLGLGLAILGMWAYIKAEEAGI